MFIFDEFNLYDSVGLFRLFLFFVVWFGVKILLNFVDVFNKYLVFERKIFFFLFINFLKFCLFIVLINLLVNSKFFLKLELFNGFFKIKIVLWLNLFIKVDKRVIDLSIILVLFKVFIFIFNK